MVTNAKAAQGFHFYLCAGWTEDMPWERLSISTNEDGFGNFVQIFQIHFDFRSSGEVQDDDHSLNGAWLEA